ncbi:hypothetical protein EUTSA_v10006346mg [Eutrema salsugineum]|uniref:Uncharacterized protein n=1 Tax=Eutrema salsugineum TaxID=72664 RepID=V4LN48_EUTSA|nr:hypothetical protein EUTSA_v10006346mg [Eutrema salsugineum]
MPSSCQVFKTLVVIRLLNDQHLSLRWDSPDCRVCLYFNSVLWLHKQYHTLRVKCFAYTSLYIRTNPVYFFSLLVISHTYPKLKA